ncbi:MAG: MgtC/SapB family protein [Stellaceae bacterium]
MLLHVTWPTILLRLVLTALAGAAIGFNRGEEDRPVGLRTTMLVALAAAIAMIQANLLLPTVGKATGSFVVLDLMRLPLGILSGMGFIGAGAIVRRHDLVLGVTTAATLWYVTVMGLCFGGGQLRLGLAALILGLLVLWGLKRVERHIGHEFRAELSVTFAAASAADEAVLGRIAAAGFAVHHRAISLDEQGMVCTLQCELRWKTVRPGEPPVGLLRELGNCPGLLNLQWQPTGRQ